MSNSVRPSQQRRGFAAVLGALVVEALVFGTPRDVSAQDSAMWSVPVRVLSAAPPTNPDRAAMPGQPPVAPSAVLPPQYQTTKRARVASEPPATDATVRFVVPLVERPILVEAQVTIDGQSFRQLRERRIETLLQELSQPEPAPSASSAEPVSEAAGDREEPLADNAAPPPKPTVDSSFLGRLRRYAEATRRKPTPEEVRWLLANWADGPTLLLLDENYQRVRAQAAPLFKVLDRDEDGLLSASEIAAAEQSLWKCDDNQDEVLSLDEINTAAKRRTPDATRTSPVPPLVPLEQLASSQVFRRLGEPYQDSRLPFDSDGDGVISEAELMERRTAQPDLTILVAFDTQDASRSRLDVISNQQATEISHPTVREHSLTWLTCGTLLELSAVQSQQRPEADQISLGAVRDGFPLLPVVDANEDGRLTIRELRQLPVALAMFDLDRDGAIAQTEILPTLRVSFGLGPIVHRQLATVRSVHPATATPVTAPPDWFARMDRNQDGDLTAREFLGSKDQFHSLDADADGLVSIAEVNSGEE